METNQNAKVYFLQQGQSISKLHGILNSNILMHHLRRWLSVVIEVFMYLFFLVMLIFAIVLPLQIPVNLNENTSVLFSAEEITEVLLILKFVTVVLSLPILAFALLLSRNRKKNNLIRKAFEETEKMRIAFETALKDLDL